jgi:hypothetical protein
MCSKTKADAVSGWIHDHRGKNLQIAMKVRSHGVRCSQSGLLSSRALVGIGTWGIGMASFVLHPGSMLKEIN